MEVEVVVRGIVALPGAALGAITRSPAKPKVNVRDQAADDPEKAEDRDRGRRRAADLRAVSDEPGEDAADTPHDGDESRMALIQFEKQLHALTWLSIQGRGAFVSGCMTRARPPMTLRFRSPVISPVLIAPKVIWVLPPPLPLGPPVIVPK